MTITRIDIVSIPESDQKVSKAFYTDMLGFQTIRDDPMGPNQQWVQMKLPGTETSITLVTWFEQLPPGSQQGMVPGTTDIKSTHVELTNKGLQLSDIKQAAWGGYATFSDPDGNGWVLQQG